MVIWHSIKKKWRTYKYNKMMRSIRDHLEFFGLDTSNLSDEDIEVKMIEISRMISKIGYTVDEVKSALIELSRLSHM